MNTAIIIYLFINTFLAGDFHGQDIHKDYQKKVRVPIFVFLILFALPGIIIFGGYCQNNPDTKLSKFCEAAFDKFHEKYKL